MAKNAVKKQKQYETDMRLKAKEGLINKADGTWTKGSSSSIDQMHLSGSLHRKV